MTPPFDEGDQRFAALSKRVLEAIAEVQEARVRWAAGDVAYSPFLPSSPPPMPSTAHTDVEVPMLRRAADEYIAHRRAEQGTSDKMIGQLRGQIDIMLDELGATTKVNEVTPQIAGKIARSLRTLPMNFRKVDALRGLTLFNAADKAHELKLKPMHPKTVNNHLTTMRGVFRDAVTYRLIEANPFVGVSIKVKKSIGSERGFTFEELERLLGCPLFIGCERAGRPFQPGLHLVSDWRFWLPLVAMLTGARIGELCQLRREDVREENGVQSLHITSAGGKRIKTDQSERMIPLHDELIRLGVLEYVQTRPLKAKPGSLFNIPEPRNHDWGAKAGNWFREKLLRNRFGTETRVGLGFYSFRHNTETSMRAAGVRQDVSHRLMGHKAADVAGGYGRYEAQAAKEAIMKIKLPAALQRISPRS